MPNNSECFLCNPNEDWVFAESPNFFAMAGLGPIVEGYSLIAFKHHVPSMLDVSSDYLGEYEAFSSRVISVISGTFGVPAITEHGRMGVCNEVNDHGADKHCFHAHQLVFPNADELEQRFLRLYPEVSIFENRCDAARHPMSGEYLYLESPSGKVFISRAHHPVYRQLFRQLVAHGEGCPGRFDWARFPGEKHVNQYAKRLREGWKASVRTQFEKVES